MAVMSHQLLVTRVADEGQETNAGSYILTDAMFSVSNGQPAA
jgi:hypothetical protein